MFRRCEAPGFLVMDFEFLRLAAALVKDGRQKEAMQLMEKHREHVSAGQLVLFKSGVQPNT